MTAEGPIAVPERDEEFFRRLIDRLLQLVSSIPSSDEKTAANPAARARSLITAAALKAAGISGALALPPGPFGLLTVLPDLYAIWRVQAQLVSDIAAVYGKSVHLTTETMLYCLFRQAAAQALRDLVVRAGERVLVRRATLRSVQSVLRRAGILATQRLIGRGVSRWLPVVGAVGVAGYAYYDTRQVGLTAIELFSHEIEDDDGGSISGQAAKVPPVSPVQPAASSAEAPSFQGGPEVK